KDDGKKVSDNSGQDADDKKFAVKDQQSKAMPNVGSATVESVSSTSQETVEASDKNAFSNLVNTSKLKTQAKVNQKNADQNNDGKDDGKKVSDNSGQDADDKKVAVKDQQSKAMPNVGSATVESVSSTSQETVEASDRNAFSNLVNNSKSKTQAKVNQKNADQNNDGKKVSDNSGQDADDKKVAVKDQQSDEKQTEKDQTATVQAEIQPVQLQEVKAISETDVKPSVTENQPSDAVTVSEVSESDSNQKLATIQQTVTIDGQTDEAQAHPSKDADEKTQASAATTQNGPTVGVQTKDTVQTSLEQMQAFQSTSVAQTQQTSQNQVQQATNQPQQTQSIVKVEEVGTVQNVETQASDAKVDLNELATLNNQAQAIQTAPADTKAAFSAKMNVATTRAAEKLAQPIVEKVSTSVAPNGELKTITLQLTPAKLGNVRIVMHVSEQGISLKFNVQTDQAKQLLQSVTGKLEQILKNAEANATQRTTQSFNLQKADQPETVTKTPQFEQDTSSLLNSNQNGSQQFNQNSMRQMRTVNGYRKAPVLETKQEDEDKKEQVPTSTISILA
ncbi:MAG: flagellar hook-length control protein FliK, partial [Ligilactobacillus ruminis]|nr:flagellar hook-length control protein FliK [Ligilactobacillus ruminis]